MGNTLRRLWDLQSQILKIAKMISAAVNPTTWTTGPSIDGKSGNKDGK